VDIGKKEFLRAEKLAIDILSFSRNLLLVHLRFLDMAIHQLKLKPYYESDTLAVDGQFLLFNP